LIFTLIKKFGIHLINLSCECCGTQDEIILNEHQVRTLSEFLKLEIDDTLDLMKELEKGE